jgi:hypothetical protein
MSRTDIYTEQKSYNPAGQHVGTIHKKNGVAYTGSWIVDGKWEHGAGLQAAAPHVSKDYSNLSGAKDHTYGGNSYVRHEDNYQNQQQQQNNSGGGARPGGNPYSSDNGGVGAGAAPGGVNFQPAGITPPPPPKFDTGSNPLIDLAKDRAQEFIKDNDGDGDISVTEKNNSIVNDIDQNIGNKGDFIVSNNPIDSDQTYATIGNDYSMNLGSINLNNQQYS